MHRLPMFALLLFLSSGWWGDVGRVTAAAFGLKAMTATERPIPPPPSDPTTDAGSEWDPWGTPRP